MAPSCVCSLLSYRTGGRRLTGPVSHCWARVRTNTGHPPSQAGHNAILNMSVSVEKRKETKGNRKKSSENTTGLCRSIAMESREDKVYTKIGENDTDKTDD